MKPSGWTSWSLCALRKVDRLIARLVVQMHLGLVTLLLLGLLLVFGSLFSSTLFVRQTLNEASEPVLKRSPNAFSQNLTYLKEAINVIRAQKRNIILNQLRNQPSVDSAVLNSTLSHISPRVKEEETKTKPQQSLSHYIRDGIFWSDRIESLRPKGFSTRDDLKWMSLLARSEVTEAESGCGRMQCRLLTLNTGDRVCARYRKNNDQILGEFYSFLLSRLLNITNVPPSVLASFSEPDSGELKWHKVRSKLKEAQWEAKPVVLTKFVDHLNAAYIPSGLRTVRRRLFPVPQDIGHLSTVEIIELVQWSDLIVLDYLTANLDRMLNNMINERWNPQMMDSPAHNLLHQEQTQLLLFIDNESGLFHGYRLLNKYDSLHRSLLDALCVFRHSTVRQLKKLHQLPEREFVALLSHWYRRYMLPHASSASVTLPPKTNLAILRHRMGQVLKQVDQCQAQFGTLR